MAVCGYCTLGRKVVEFNSSLLVPCSFLELDYS